MTNLDVATITARITRAYTRGCPPNTDLPAAIKLIGDTITDLLLPPVEVAPVAQRPKARVYTPRKPKAATAAPVAAVDPTATPPIADAEPTASTTQYATDTSSHITTGLASLTGSPLSGTVGTQGPLVFDENHALHAHGYSKTANPSGN